MTHETHPAPTNIPNATTSARSRPRVNAMDVRGRTARRHAAANGALLYMAASLCAAGCGSSLATSPTGATDGGDAGDLPTDAATPAYDSGPDGGGLGDRMDGGAPPSKPITPPPVTAPSFDACTVDDDCSVGDCITFPGGTMCSTLCTTTGDCESVPGSDAIPYCVELPGLDACALACPPGLACPDGMGCVDATCVPAGVPYTTCPENSDCGAGTFCSPTRSFCTVGCTEASECPTPTTGSPTPECLEGRCALRCEGEDTCPDGMQCGDYDYCGF